MTLGINIPPNYINKNQFRVEGGRGLGAPLVSGAGIYYMHKLSLRRHPQLRRQFRVLVGSTSRQCRATLDSFLLEAARSPNSRSEHHAEVRDFSSRPEALRSKPSSSRTSSALFPNPQQELLMFGSSSLVFQVRPPICNPSDNFSQSRHTFTICLKRC